MNNGILPEKLADEVAPFIKDIMEQTGNEMCPGVPFKVDVVKGRSWADK
jgi:DNA polymerase I-like protein with 3'-5' exonuclease and polymerase domains